VAKNYTQYFNDVRLSKSLEAREVLTKEQTSVADLSRRYDVDLDTLRVLNPALAKPVLKGQRQVPKGIGSACPLIRQEHQGGLPLHRCKCLTTSNSNITLSAAAAVEWPRISPSALGLL